MNNYINSKSIKDLALHLAKEYRPAWGAERVSQKFLERINYKVRALVLQEVKAHPSIGKTIL
jgi:hypothetical protein